MKYFGFVLLGIVIVGGVLLFDVQEEVALPKAVINGAEIQLEIVRIPEEQARGLSGRESLAANAGMLFVYGEQTTPSFWMKEMNFPIDIIWIGGDKRVVDISENLAPETFPEAFYPSGPVKYVLEVNAGWAETHNASIGDTVEFQVDL